jgi:hypothetical protein
MKNSLFIVRKFFPKVKSVVDAKRGIKIHVSPKDSKPDGRRKHQECAMAVACKRQFNLDGVIISRERAYTIKNNVATRYLFSSSVSKEIVSFDRGGEFNPGDYKLCRPSKSARLGKYQGSKNSGPKLSKPRPRFRHVTQHIRTSILGNE